MAYEDVFRSIKVKDKITLGGSSTNPALTSTASTNFFPIYGKSTATSGDARCVYSRLYLAGAGGAGEAVRAFTTINGVAAANAHGIHASVSFGTVSAVVGSVTGQALAVRATLQIPNSTLSGGTFAAIEAELYGEGASSTIASMTECSFIRFNADGATADVKATIDTSGYLFSIQGLTKGSGKLFQDNTAANASQALRIKIGATPYFIMLTSTGA